MASYQKLASVEALRKRGLVKSKLSSCGDGPFAEPKLEGCNMPVDKRASLQKVKEEQIVRTLTRQATGANCKNSDLRSTFSGPFVVGSSNRYNHHAFPMYEKKPSLLKVQQEQIVRRSISNQDGDGWNSCRTVGRMESVQEALSHRSLDNNRVRDMVSSYNKRVRDMFSSYLRSQRSSLLYTLRKESPQLPDETSTVAEAGTDDEEVFVSPLLTRHALASQGGANNESPVAPLAKHRAVAEASGRCCCLAAWWSCGDFIFSLCGPAQRPRTN